MATLRDLDPQPFVIAPADGLPVTAPGDRWLVLVRDGQVVSAVPPGTSLDGDERPPGVLVAAASLYQATAFRSAAFQQLAGTSALVLTEPPDDPAGQPLIVGVVGGVVLTRAVQRGAVRGPTGPVLPGPPAIPWIARSCGYRQAGTACATPMSFPSRPYPMPDCPNAHALTAHLFTW
jgi:hypothetical protein